MRKLDSTTPTDDFSTSSKPRTTARRRARLSRLEGPQLSLAIAAAKHSGAAVICVRAACGVPLRKTSLGTYGHIIPIPGGHVPLPMEVK